jgi:glycosyltransferase involved in cell wall biosynthesis
MVLRRTPIVSKPKIMLEKKKDIRIVIPAFNASSTIQKCLDGVLGSISFFESWEIIIVDNGQNPDLLKLLKDYPVSVIKQDKHQSAAFARNEGAKGFLNGILIFIDSDVVCEKDCIENLIKPIQNNLCDATIGNYSKNLKGLSFTQKYKQLYINHIYSRENKLIKNDFWTAICSVNAHVFNKLNGLNTNFKGANGEDQEFGIRLTKNGYNVLFVKNANGQHLNPYGVLNIFRNDFKKGVTAVKNSLENKVPFSDNRHSKMSDILAVIFAVLTIITLFFSLINSDLVFYSIMFFILWFTCRIFLNITFYKNGGLIFCIRALLLMFSLDLIRFICVIIGFKNNFLKKSLKQ